jgi:hypothetical protein
MEELDNAILILKLPDFKKKIKPLGLQITGNKPDLTKAFKLYIKKGGKPISYWISYLQSTGEDSGILTPEIPPTHYKYRTDSYRSTLQTKSWRSSRKIKRTWTSIKWFPPKTCRYSRCTYKKERENF